MCLFTPALESGYMCALFTCCYVRFRWDSDCVCHVLMAEVVALCS